jgi:hypothetical protein
MQRVTYVSILVCIIFRPLVTWVERIDINQRELIHNANELQSAGLLCCHKLLVSLKVRVPQ